MCVYARMRMSEKILDNLAAVSRFGSIVCNSTRLRQSMGRYTGRGSDPGGYHINPGVTPFLPPVPRKGELVDG